MAIARLLADTDDMAHWFGAATVARGTRYAEEGRVHHIDWAADEQVLSGMCVGTGGQAYCVDIGFEDCPGGLTMLWTACDCPVAESCKHAVALLLAASAGERLSPDPDRWRPILVDVLAELDAMAVAPPAPCGSGAPVGLQFSLTKPTRYLPDRLVLLRPVTTGKRGTWIKTGLTWQRLWYGDSSGEFEPGQYRAVRTLAAVLQRSGAAPHGQGVMIGRSSPALWAELAAVQDAGVAMVADKSSGLRAVELAKKTELRVEFSADGAGGAVMKAVLLIDGERTDPAGITLIGSPRPHGVQQIVDGLLRLGRLDPVPGPAMLDLYLHGGTVAIPVDSLDEVSMSVLPRLNTSASLEVEDGLFEPPVISGPVPVVTIKMTGGGARAYWSIRYEVNDKRHDFDPDSTAKPSSYRDAATEETAWRLITTALRAVAAASASWHRHAAHQVHRRLMGGALDPAGVTELHALQSAGDTAAAVAVASIATLRGGVDLTPLEAAVLCAETLPALDCRDGFLVEIDHRLPELRPATGAPQVSFSGADGDADGTDWFNLNIAVCVDEHRLPLSEVIAELAAGATHMLLPDRTYFRLDNPELTRLAVLLDEARALGEIDDGKAKARTLNVTLWEELLTLGVVDKQVSDWRSNLTRLAAARPPEAVPTPPGLNATLRDYQRDGLDWLAFLWDNGLGGVLADDMGLGKTVQTLALIARATAAGAGKFLVVAPTSVVGNWAAEVAKFTPGLTAVAIDATRARSALDIAELTADADIVITSYTLLRIDFDVYAEVAWAGAIFDEAQFVKNHNSKTHQAARRLEAGFKLAITGTPMENTLMELWSLLSITVPGLFPSPRVFTDYFRKPIESGSHRERLAVLRRRIKPVLLRRTKNQVADELPAKQEHLLSIGLNTRHRKIYETRLARERQKVLGLLGDWEKNRFQIFRSLTMLRQLSLHPGLVDAADHSAGSAKIDYLITQLPQLVAEGHSALVFSQFTQFLGIVRNQLDAVGIGYSYLDGSLSARARKAALAEFTGGATQVFLISLKSGGFGLNLTQADYCFVCDPWWSPAAEAQAVDRTHRIGQTRPVNVYRLVSAETIEEKVVALQQRKRDLFAAVLDEGELFGTAISAADVRELVG